MKRELEPGVDDDENEDGGGFNFNGEIMRECNASVLAVC